MQRALEFEYAAPPDAVYRALLSLEYRRAAARNGKERQEVLAERDDGERQERVVELSGPGAVPEGVARLLRLPSLSFRLEESYAHAARAWSWRLRPSHFDERVLICGAERLEPARAGAGSVRRVELRVEVELALLGARVERAVLDSIGASIESAVDFDREWLRAHAVSESAVAPTTRGLRVP